MKNVKFIVILLCITLVSLLSGCSKEPFTTKYTNIMLDKFVFPREGTEINVKELVVYYNETEIQKLFFYETLSFLAQVGAIPVVGWIALGIMAACAVAVATVIIGYLTTGKGFGISVYGDPKWYNLFKGLGVDIGWR